MIEFWDSLPTWLQQVIAIVGYLLAVLGRVWARLPRRFTLFEKIKVDRREGREGRGSIVVFGRDWITWGEPELRPLDDDPNRSKMAPPNGTADHTYSKPTRNLTQHTYDQQPNQPDQQHEQPTADSSADDAPNKPS